MGNINFKLHKNNKEIIIERTFIKGKFNKTLFENTLTKLIKDKKVTYYFNTSIKNYKIIISILKKNLFKLALKKLVFLKKITKIKEPLGITFKPLNKIGIPLFFKLYKEAIKNTKDSDFDEDRKNMHKGFNEILSNMKKWNLVAYVNNKIIGFLILDKFDKYYSINFLYINPKYRGKGYSLLMLQKAEFEFYKVKAKQWLESTSESNVAMKKVLKKYGFKKLREVYCFKRL